MHLKLDKLSLQLHVRIELGLLIKVFYSFAQFWATDLFLCDIFHSSIAVSAASINALLYSWQSVEKWGKEEKVRRQTRRRWRMFWGGYLTKQCRPGRTPESDKMCYSGLNFLTFALLKKCIDFLLWMDLMVKVLLSRWEQTICNLEVMASSTSRFGLCTHWMRWSRDDSLQHLITCDVRVTGH